MIDEKSRDLLCLAIGERIKSARITAEMSRKNLGDYLGLTYSAIAMWERGKRFPTVADFYEMSLLFSKVVYDLLPPNTTSALAKHRKGAREIISEEFDFADVEGVSSRRPARPFKQQDIKNQVTIKRKRA